jgi:type I restriction enzyme S subunit
MNITGGSIGRCCIVPDNFDIGNINQHVSIVRVVDYSIKEFLHTVLISPYIFNSIMNIQVGISREGLSITKLAKFLIPIPPLAEQKRIVEREDLLMRLCDELENNIQQSKKNSERLMQSVLQDVFNDSNEKNNQLSFGEFIKQKRKDKGITITYMLELLKDVKSSEYTKIEEGFVKPEQFIIEKIANVLKLSEIEIKYLKKLKIKTDLEKCLNSDYEIKIAARRINKN